MVFHDSIYIITNMIGNIMHSQFFNGCVSNFVVLEHGSKGMLLFTLERTLKVQFVQKKT